MSSGWKSIDYIKDALDAIEKISQFIQGMTYESFVNDDKTLFAVVRGIEIIGEATKNLSKERKEAYPNLPWREISGMRDKLIHAYFGVDKKVVWKTATEDLPVIEPKIQAEDLYIVQFHSFCCTISYKKLA